MEFFGIGMILIVIGVSMFGWDSRKELHKTKQELAEAKEKIAALEKHSGRTPDDGVKAT